MSETWERLMTRVRELNDLSSAVTLFHWDQAVMMPPRGAPARARAMATLEGILHDRLTEPDVGSLLDELNASEDLDEDQRASIRVLKRDYDRATRVPKELVKKIAEAQGRSYQAWTEARPKDDFEHLKPHLEQLVELKREEADALGWEEERYDALLDNFEPGMTARDVGRMFSELVDGLRQIIDPVLDAAGQPPEWLVSSFDVTKQTDFCRWLVARLGFDLGSGRLDESPHPFTIPVAPGDVRQTTRAEPNAFLTSIYAAIHETGHALYEQGIPERMLEKPVGRAPSLGMHESQSRLWENQMGRSRAFSEFLLVQLKDRWAEEIGMVTPEDFYRGVNHPRRTLIRVTADELTYNLHVAMRFEIERALFEDRLAVPDLPDAWNESSEKIVGIRPNNFSDGVLQDMHWSMGALGYFPTYTLGNIYAAAFYAKATEDLGSLEDELRAGETSRLLSWLRDKVHSQGYRYQAKELSERIVGGPVTARPLLDHMRAKYTELYDVSI